MPEIGYGQGMSFMGELILFAILEEDHTYDQELAFWIFLYIMDAHNYKGLFQYPFSKRLEMLNTLKFEIKMK